MGFRLQSPNSQEGSYIKSWSLLEYFLFLLLVVLTFGVVNAKNGKHKALLKHTMKQIVENPELLTKENVQKFVEEHPKATDKLKKIVKELQNKKPEVLKVLKQHIKSIDKKAYHEIKKKLRD